MRHKLAINGQAAMLTEQFDMAPELCLVDQRFEHFWGYNHAISIT
jgi:hypothetical protein